MPTETSTSNVSSISQKAAEAGLRGPQDCVTAMLDEYRRRRDQVTEWLAAGKTVPLIHGECRVEDAIKRVESQLRLA